MEFLLTEKKKFKQKEISFFLFNFFFKYVKHDYFESHYFLNFTYHEIKKGEFLFHQNSPPEFIYLIKEGEITLVSNFSLDSLCKLIDSMADKVSLKVKRLDRVDFGKIYKIIETKILI